MTEDIRRVTTEIPLELMFISHNYCFNVTGRNTLRKLYSIIKNKCHNEHQVRKRKNNNINIQDVYVHLSKNYFVDCIGGRYNEYLNILKFHDLIRPKKREVIIDDIGIEINPFYQLTESYKVGYYSKAYCIVETEGELIDFTDDYKIKHSIVSQKNIEFLKSIGIENFKIKTDNYGFRLYHNLSTTYKEILPKYGDFIYYDFDCSIPHHFKNFISELLTEEQLSNNSFIELFKGDFYINFGVSLGLTFIEKEAFRKKMKKLFSSIVYGENPKSYFNYKIIIKNKFPVFYSLLGKNTGRNITRSETKFVLKTIIEQLTPKNILTIHDGFIVYPEDKKIIDEALEQLIDQDKFPFSMQLLNKKSDS